MTPGRGPGKIAVAQLALPILLLPVLLLLLLGFAAEPAHARGFLGISATNAAEPPKLPATETRAFASALDVVFVAPDSPGEAADFREGDAILAVNGAAIDPASGDPAIRWRRLVTEAEPGTRLTLTVLRRGLVTTATRDGKAVEHAEDLLHGLASSAGELPEGGKLRVEVTRESRVEDVELTVAKHPLDDEGLRTRDVDGGSAIRGDHATPDDAVRLRALAHSLESTENAGRLDALEAGLRAIAGSADGVRLGRVRSVQADPWSLPGRVPQIPLAAADVLLTAARELPLPPGAIRPGSVDGDDFPQVDPKLDHLLSELGRSLGFLAAARDRAVGALSPEERAALVKGAPAFVTALSEMPYLHADEDRGRARANRRILDSCRRIDPVALQDEVAKAARLADAAWLSRLRAVLAAQPTAGEEFVARRSTAFGEIVIGGTGRNVWRDVDPALIIDLGGDDLYANGAGAARGDERPVSIVIDFAGNDAYESTEPFAQGTGLLGIGMLIDLAGDDRYLAGDGAQGTAFGGIGLLWDASGEDRYRARHFAQGTAFFGAGILLDSGGRDAYEAASHAQGLGLPSGFGLLRDVAGDDRYFSKGGAKTGYGTQGVFDAWSQGCGMGLRYLASGGLGMLSDGSGSDVYEAGNFSQGGGYFFGFGFLHDEGNENDRYIASRYGQGWSAHQAVGAFLEEGGDDVYETTHGVIAGLAWDQSVSWFRDVAGNDTYRGSFFSLGASAHDSICLFEDLSGSDRYEGTEIGRSGPNDYHGGTSFSLFLDLGPGEDAYEKGPPGTLQRNGEHGVALDRPVSRDALLAAAPPVPPPAPAAAPPQR